MFLCFNTGAEIRPFGLHLGKDTIKTVKDKIGTKIEYKSEGTNSWTKGPQYNFKNKSLGLEGIKEICLIFDTKEILLGIIVTLPKHRYDNILNTLKKKYPIHHEQNSFVGNKSAIFKEDDVKLTVSAPHMNFSMDLLYTHKKFDMLFEKGVKEENRQEALL